MEIVDKIREYDSLQDERSKVLFDEVIENRLYNMMNKKGLLISFEGLDCSFKETNSRKLYEYIKTLEDTYGDIVHFRSYPRYDVASSYYIKQYLAGKYEGTEMGSPVMASTFYLLDQIDDHIQNIKPLLDAGKIVITDRSWVSNLYHQVCRVNSLEEKKILVDFITSEAEANGLVYPNIIFLMRMPFEDITRLLKEKDSKNDIHESKLDYMKSVFEEYSSLHLLNMVNINCTQLIRCNIKSEDEIFDYILYKLNDISENSPIDGIVNNKTYYNLLKYVKLNDIVKPIREHCPSKYEAPIVEPSDGVNVVAHSNTSEEIKININLETNNFVGSLKDDSLNSKSHELSFDIDNFIVNKKGEF